MRFEVDGRRPTLIVLRYGDPVVDALEAAGPGPLVILRVLPPVLRGARPVEAEEGGGPWDRAERARLADLVAGRRPVPRLVVCHGETVEVARGVVAGVRPARVVCPRNLVRRLARAVAVPVAGAEGAVGGSPAGPLGLLRRALRPGDEKIAALRQVALFAGVEMRDLRLLAGLLDGVEVGRGHVLVREGRRNDALWLMLAGTARASMAGGEVGHLRAPALVGVPSMVSNRPAIATVTALEPVRALVAGRAQYRAIAAIEPVALRLRAATADRLSDYLNAGGRPHPAGSPNGRRALA
jgi:hypothetical protein